jgi:hypothetical protein
VSPAAAERCLRIADGTPARGVPKACGPRRRKATRAVPKARGGAAIAPGSHRPGKAGDRGFHDRRGVFRHDPRVILAPATHGLRRARTAHGPEAACPNPTPACREAGA